MDTETAKIILDLAKLSIGESRKDEVAKKLTEIQSKMDQPISQELKAPFEALTDALLTHDQDTRQIRLHFAEENLLRNTNLNPSSRTGDTPNTALMALAHYGLAFVSVLRDDPSIAAKHLLRVYEIDPRMARTELAPEIYEKVIKPRCQDVYAWFDKEMESIHNNAYILKTIAGKTGAVLFGALVYGIARAVRVQVPNPAAVKPVQDIWNQATPDHYRSDAKIELSTEFQLKLDSRCREVAADLSADKFKIM